MIATAIIFGLAIVVPLALNRAILDRFIEYASRLETLAERIEKTMASAPATITTTVPCPRLGTDAEVTTNRQDGETSAEHAARHVEAHEAMVDACKVVTGPGGG